MAATYAPEAAGLRAYLTGFSEEALGDFAAIEPPARVAYRCSVHCPLDDLPEVRLAIEPDGRLYATLCEFQTQELLPEGDDASAIIGVVGSRAGFAIEARLNVGSGWCSSRPQTPLRRQSLAKLGPDKTHRGEVSSAPKALS